MPGSESRQNIMRFLGTAETDLLDAVMKLADANKATLGYIPWGAWPGFAAKQTLLVAESHDGRLLGYALFDIARNRVRLIHLCVASAARGQGVARDLVDEIASRFGSARGIVAKCRPEYDADGMWPRLGFAPVNEVPGRSASGAPLTVWFRSNNNPDLFTLADDDDAIVVALDHNVFLDLCIYRDREGAAESQVLESDWLVDQIRVQSTPETLTEINRIPFSHAAERARQRSAALAMGQLDVPVLGARQASVTLRAALPPVTPAERSDLNHVAQAAAAGASVLLTRDDAWIAKVADAAAETLGIRVMRPSDLVVHLDELQHAARYRPAALRGTELSRVAIPTNAEQALRDLIDNAGGESKASFLRRVRATALDRNGSRYYIHDAAGQVLVAWTLRQADFEPSCEVDLFRVGTHPLAPTVASMVIFDVRRETYARSSLRTVIRDPYIGRTLTALLLDAGFESTPQGMVAYPLHVTSTQQAIDTVPADSALVPLLEAVRDGRADLKSVAWLEHALHPGKLLDTELPTYVVPIRPHWAYELLGLRQGLWDPPSLLGASPEHVYYRYRSGNPPENARIVWYVSTQKGAKIQQVVGCSLLRGVETGAPTVLFRRNQHFGVYSLEDVRRAGPERVSALRFSDTELFRKPIGLAHLQTLADRHNSRLGTLQSPTRITSALFNAIIQEAN